MESMKKLTALLLTLMFMSVSALHAEQQNNDDQTERKQIRWDLTDLYPSDEAWEKAFDDVSERIEKLERFKDNFAKSASVLADQLIEQDDLTKDFYRMAIYANMQNDEDQRDPVTQQRRAKVRGLGAKFSELTSWQSKALRS